jgi:hypothetical protein
VHSIDGNRWQNKTYTTNDINQLPASAIKAYQTSKEGKIAGDGYLGGI